MISEIPRAELGLMTVSEAAELRGWVVRTVQKWIADGLLPVVCAGDGRRGVYLLRVKDVKTFTPPTRGPKPKDKPKQKAKKK